MLDILEEHQVSIMNLIHCRIKYIKISKFDPRMDILEVHQTSITIHCWPLPVLQLWSLQAAENLSRLKSGNRLADPKKNVRQIGEPTN